MTGMKSFDKFLDFFNSNAGGVISTITNQQINFTFNQYIAFDFSLLESNLNIPCILSHIDFTGTEDFQLSMITSKKVVASFADLMMLGTGDAEYSPEEHNDAMKEIFNQVFGSLTTELTAEGVQVAGVATNVELSDLELQKEFMQDSKLVELQFTLLGNQSYIYLVIDEETEKTLDSLFKQKAPEKQKSAPKQSGNKASGGQQTVTASRASFSEIEEISPTNSKNINLDNLLDIPLPVTVELGRKEMRIKDILDLGQGAIVELTKLAGDLVDLYINGKKFAVGEVMVVDENYAVRIVSLISREERIKSLGPE